MNVEKIIFDRHARHRMKWRGISEQEIEITLANPDKIEPTEKGRLNAFKKVGARHLKVTYREFPDHLLIITAVDKSD